MKKLRKVKKSLKIPKWWKQSKLGNQNRIRLINVHPLSVKSVLFPLTVSWKFREFSSVATLSARLAWQSSGDNVGQIWCASHVQTAGMLHKWYLLVICRKMSMCFKESLRCSRWIYSRLMRLQRGLGLRVRAWCQQARGIFSTFKYYKEWTLIMKKK